MPAPSVVLATASYDHTIRLWEATSGVCHRTLQYADSVRPPPPPPPPPPGPPAARPPAPRTCPAPPPNPAAGGGLRPVPDPRRCCPCPGRGGGADPRRPPAPQQVNKLEITSDKQYLAAAGNPHVRLFEVNSSNGQPVSSYDGHQGNVTAVGFQRDNKWMFTGSEDGTVKIWDLRAPGYQRQYESRAAVNTVALHPNQGELISGDQNGNIRVWDLRENLCSSEYVPEVGTAVRSISVASDGSLAVAANNSGTCFVWQLVSKGEAAGASQGVTHFEPLHKLQAHDGKVLKCLLSPDVQHLATTSSDNTIKIWQLDGFGLKQTLVGHQKWVWDCVFSVDAAYLVTASSDCTARLWDLSASEAIRVYSGHHKAVVCCALNDSSEGT